MNRVKETSAKVVFTFMALLSVIAILLICIFLFANGIPAIKEIGIKNCLFGTKWAPTNGNPSYGIMPMICGSIVITIGAIIVGVPIGILTAVFMARFCPKKLYSVLKTASDLMAGIPSVVYGFFGLVILVPMVRMLRDSFGVNTNGCSILTASVLLGIMILPTIVSVSESSVRAVTNTYYEGARALGATHERSVFRVIVPAAKSGILASVMLGVGRAIGGPMAVIMVAGNQARMPEGILDGVRTMTANIVIEMGYATGLHREALIATGMVLFVFILIINHCFSTLKRKES